MTRSLLAVGAIDVNAADDAGQTPLHRAAQAGNREVVEMLLAQPGIDANAFMERSGTPLHHAIANGHEGVALKLMECPAVDINCRGPHCSPPLALAIYRNAMKCVRVLCARKDLEVTGDLRMKSATPPLMVAVSA
jgi:ankyrin repeat protein